jgi:sterol desaturase/sphingolipid hydroxylase (fatty acid hydroxylase superfamily)
VNLKNQFVTFAVSILHHIFLGNLLRIKISRELPSFPIVFRDLIILALFEDIFFYYSHRLLHHRWFYHLHKQHHEFITPSCLTAQYAGTIEHILSNLIPVVSGFVFTGSHMSTALLHVTVVFMTITHDHSGNFRLSLNYLNYKFSSLRLSSSLFAFK